MHKLNILITILIFLAFNSVASQEPNVPEKYKKYFVKYSTEKSIYSEKIAPLFGGAKTGRSFALVAGISDYKFGELPPAKVDIESITSYLLDEEHFDEVVVLTEEDVNYTNLKFFLQSYFKSRVQDYPQSRFLFAYSGHGNLDGRDGYIVEKNARSLSDLSNSISVDILRNLIEKVMDKAHHTLVLLNACHAGSFLNYSHGEKQYIPRKRGAHAITAGGTSEKTYSIAKVGNGSVFFELFLDGVRGAADTVPQKGDGIVTFRELFQYIHSNTILITDAQIPREGDLRPSDDTSEGSFFFIDSDVDIKEPTALSRLVNAIGFGGKPELKYFLSEPKTLVQGDSATLKWESDHSESCSFTDSDQIFEPEDERTIYPTINSSYTLICTDGVEKVRSTLDVNVIGRPNIGEFYSSPSSIEDGGRAELIWNSDNTQLCTIDNGIGPVSSSGRISVAPKASTTYTIYCSTQNKEISAGTLVRVLPAKKPVSIRSFEVSDTSIKSGQSTTLRWRTSNAEYCELEDGEDFSTKEVNVNSSERITPSSDSEYSLTCYGADGSEETDYANIYVENNRTPENSGFPSGYGMKICGCWGYNPPAYAPEPRCQSGTVRINMCPGFCQGGGSPYAYVCS